MPFDGKTYQYHLNRLAGTLSPYDTPTLDAQGAANVWAGTENLAIVGALNNLYEQRNGVNYNYDLQGVLNALAGTWGLGPNLAASLIAS